MCVMLKREREGEGERGGSDLCVCLSPSLLRFSFLSFQTHTHTHYHTHIPISISLSVALFFPLSDPFFRLNLFFRSYGYHLLFGHFLFRSLHRLGPGHPPRLQSR
jgi:hypothetical protein